MRYVLSSCLFLFLSLNSSGVDFFSGRPATCMESLSNFVRAPKLSNQAIGYGESSLSKKFDSYLEFRRTMLELRPSIQNFLKRKSKEGLAKKVSFGEVIDFYFDAHSRLIEHLESAIGIDEEIDQYLLTLINGISMPARKYQSLSKIKEDKKLLKKKFNLKDPRQEKFINSLAPNQYKGLVGEFDIAMRFNNVVGQSFLIGEDYLQNEKMNSMKFLFTRRMTKAFKQISSYSNRALQTKYPKIFRADHNLSRKDFLKEAKNFILQKEFDLVSYKDERFQILEVKNIKEPLQLKHLESKFKKKTILDQVIEDKEILEFLGLNDQVDFAIVLLRGVSSSAMKILREHNVRVYADIIIEE